MRRSGQSVFGLRAVDPADLRHSDRDIRFVSCSATISRPKEHMKTIFGLEVCLYSSRGPLIPYFVITARMSKQSLKMTPHREGKSFYYGVAQMDRKHLPYLRPHELCRTS